MSPNPLELPPAMPAEHEAATTAFDQALASLREGEQTREQALQSMAEQMHAEGVRIDLAKSFGAWLTIAPQDPGTRVERPEVSDLGPYFDVDPEPDGFWEDDIDAALEAWYAEYIAKHDAEHPPEDHDEPEAGVRAVRASYEQLDEAQAETDGGAEHYTDLGFARRLVRQHGSDLRHVPGIGWHRWDGARWAYDDDGEVDRRAHGVTDGILDDARKLAQFGSDKADKLWAWGIKSQGSARIAAGIDRASKMTAVIAHVADLDADPFLVNCENGTLDVRTGQLREHRRADLITKQTGHTYSANAGCPTFARYLRDVTGGDASLVAYLQRAVGYTLTGDTREQCLFVLHGDGSNGKTTLLETVAHILGDYARSADPGSFTTAASGRSVRSDLARLRGARLVRAAEVERDAAFAESLIKQLTGGEPITAAFKFKDEFEYRPTFKLWIAANDLPAVLGDDHAIWRRLRVIPFAVRIDNPDKRLAEKLKAEAPGILAWAVQGAVDWYRGGLGDCAAVTAATGAYGVQQDRVGAFLDDCCRLDPHERVENGALLSTYQLWEQAHGREPLKDFYRRLDRRGLRSLKSNGKRYRAGLALLVTEEGA